jgi:hypothetical protein
LTEEWTNIAKVMMPPVFQEPGRFGRYLPLIGVSQASPSVDVTANFVDDRCGIVGRRIREALLCQLIFLLRLVR